MLQILYARTKETRSGRGRLQDTLVEVMKLFGIVVQNFRGFAVMSEAMLTWAVSCMMDKSIEGSAPKFARASNHVLSMKTSSWL